LIAKALFREQRQISELLVPSGREEQARGNLCWQEDEESLAFRCEQGGNEEIRAHGTSLAETEERDRLYQLVASPPPFAGQAESARDVAVQDATLRRLE
jgi:hypothetical protein